MPYAEPPTAPRKIRVLCVEDNCLVAQMLEQCIALAPDMESAGILPRADGLAAAVEETHPDVILLDLTMPGEDPLAVLHELNNNRPPPRATNGSISDENTADTDHPVRAIIFSGHTNQDAFDRAEKAGACGFLAKDADMEVIFNAIRETAQGTLPFSVWL